MTGFTAAAAIDFGSYQSGFAWAPLTDTDEGPVPGEIRWRLAWPGQGAVSSPKTLSALRLADGDIVAWGDMAVQQPEAGEPGFLRRGFKMDLARATGLVPDSLGPEELTEDEVRPLVVGYLRRLFDAALTHLTGEGHEPDAVRWCLTVPALWGEYERQLMLRWAVEAGMPGSPERLLLAIEPEVAGLHALAEHEDLNRHGHRLLVVDAGGGTVDITTLQVQADGLAQVGTPVSGGCGSDYVNRLFLERVVSGIGPVRMYELARRHSHVLFRLAEAFETAKREFDPNNPDDTNVLVPQDVHRILPDDIKKALAERQDGVYYAIVIPRDTMRELLDHTIDDVLKMVDEQLDEVGADDLTVVLAGGFGRSTYLRDRLDAHLAGRLPWRAVSQAELAVLRGAVRFAADPATFRRRQARTTYGIARTVPFDPELDPPEKKIEFAFRAPLCGDRFEPLVRAGDIVPYDKVFRVEVAPALWRRRTFVIPLYATDSPHAPRYVDADGCRKVATLSVKLPWRMYARPTRLRRFELTVRFGSTHLTATATNLITGDEVAVSAEFDHRW
ncbi:Hsp70 family protein [Actinophytocola sp.]|uniref:Hsp70 family protein n=1 Tax=Actinophytocola sp. TaxID=1872138 RepID=UPI002ED06643